ncbi:MAG TPA: GTPase ObgE, partial [Pelotomaculum sp.]|nr:GTPase ObgE [Pelotomaculum sp.]
EAAENLARLKAAYGNDYEIFPISAATGSGLDSLIYKVAALLEDLPGTIPPAEETAEHVVYRAEPRFSISREDGIFQVGGKEIKRHVAMTDLENDEAVERLQWIFKRMGIDDALKEAGIKEGDTVKIGDFEFEYVE